MARKNDLGLFVRQRRKKLNLQLDEFAARAGIEAGYLNNIEGGSKTPSDAVKMKIAEVIGINPGLLTDLFAGTVTLEDAHMVADLGAQAIMERDGILLRLPKLPEDYLEKINNYVEDQVKVYRFETDKLIDSSGNIHPLKPGQAKQYGNIVEEMDDIQDYMDGEIEPAKPDFEPSEAESENIEVKN